MIKADTINNLLLKFAIAHNSQFSDICNLNTLYTIVLS